MTRRQAKALLITGLAIVVGSLAAAIGIVALPWAAVGMVVGLVLVVVAAATLSKMREGPDTLPMWVGRRQDHNGY